MEVIRRPIIVRPRPPEEIVPRPVEEAAIERMLNTILNEVLALKRMKEIELEIIRHTRTIPEDYDASDGVVYDLESGYFATVTLDVPGHYIFLFKKFFTTDVVGTTYAIYIDNRLYIQVPDLEFPVELGVPVEDEVKIVVTNLSGSKQTYITYMAGIFRPRNLWERAIRRVW